MTSRRAVRGPARGANPAVRGSIIGLDDLKTVLVADSDLNSRAIIADLLTDQGYHVVVAANGEQALAIVEQGGIDLLVSAMTMTGMDGLELLWALRDAEVETPVIAMASGSDVIDQVYLRSALLYGAAKTYSRPLTPALFLDGVREVLEPSDR